MRVTVKLFALAKEAYGKSSIPIELPAEATVGLLRHRLAEEIPTIVSLFPQMLIAVNSDYADDEKPIYQGDEVACIPPVSGG